MARRRGTKKREVLPDPIYKDTLVTKFINSLMYSGKKSVAEGIFYKTLDLIKNFFTSLTMLFKLKDVGSSRCLCCGGSNLFINDSEISCPNCSASYLMFQNQKDKYVWIKKLWRIK